MATLFIGSQYIKDSSYIDENVDEKLLKSTIADTQDFRILNILGTALYNSLKDTAPTTWNASQLTLVNDYIKPALKYWVLHDGGMLFQYKIMNKGIVKRTSENADSIDSGELKMLLDLFRSRAEFYSERITKYLLQNNTTYPLYNNFGTGIDAVAPAQSNYTGGWYLDDNNDCGYKGIDSYKEPRC